MPNRETRYALITGCGTGGIGEALAHEFTARGIHAIATVLPPESGEHLSNAGITWFPLDVTQESSIMALKNFLLDITGGELDFLVNNAYGHCPNVIESSREFDRFGLGYTMTAIDTDIRCVQTMFDVNVFGPIRMVHHLHDMLIRSSGTVVNIGSIGGVVPYVYGSSYNATKAALAHWSNTLRVEMAPLE
ncbi:NADPH-dependent 1-acyldihydroxyacetone phosphate reductase 2 [Colletotrichum musicola]|uniref:NADPH-dependent 1-acyldihydroxyacetone phosphate reductase 2 n=1 Tax=Colletotrichum musicola TaxID=2175873 RepID=A0A8H6MYQ7_9PEZI|nr:NADPH-dependent 1-acyldihydroxyacetone phosphate reductase 2 [Colletotrichum musicola]